MGSTKKKKNNKNKNKSSASKQQPTNNGTTNDSEVVVVDSTAAATTTKTSDPIIVPVQLDFDTTTTTTTTTTLTTDDNIDVADGTLTNNKSVDTTTNVTTMIKSSPTFDLEKSDDDWESVAVQTTPPNNYTDDVKTTPVVLQPELAPTQEQQQEPTDDENRTQLPKEDEVDNTTTINEKITTNLMEDTTTATNTTTSTTVDDKTPTESSIPDQIVEQGGKLHVNSNNDIASSSSPVVATDDSNVTTTPPPEIDNVVESSTALEVTSSIIVEDSLVEPVNKIIVEAKSTDSTPTITNKIVVEIPVGSVSTNGLPSIGLPSTTTTSSNQKLSVEIFSDVLKTDYYDCLQSTGIVDTSKLLVGAIDQGTSSTRFVVFTHRGRIAACSQMEHTQYYPQTGWHEHDPIEIWNNTVLCIEKVVTKLRQDPYNITLGVDTLASIGITNQRETTIAWNRTTGQPYYNAIVWDCARTADIADDLAAADPVSSQNRFRPQTGLPLSSYFAGTKVKWLLDNVPALQHDLHTNPSEICFGTIDTWLLYQLTGQQNFQTDVSNASRWLFLDLQTCQWDKILVDTICAPHQIPLSALPEICPSSYIYGKCTKTIVSNATTMSDRRELDLPVSIIGVPIASVLGDQQAALFGQAAFQPGEAKNTYGTGLFLMMNTGTKPVPSKHGLLTTVAYQIGKDGPVHYALEGSVAFSGSTIQWLRDRLGIIKNASESEKLAALTSSNDGLYFVPAFSGLLAPYWRSDARGCIVGMSASHHKGHICRAALESTAYQTKSVFDAITADSSGISLQKLNVDGGGTHNRLLMQFQADIINVPVVKPVVMETTSMGAAFAAGLATGVWSCLGEIQTLWAVAETYHPRMSKQDREQNWNGWIKAVDRSFGWIDHPGSESTTGNTTIATSTNVSTSSESTTSNKTNIIEFKEETSNESTDHRSRRENDLSPNPTVSTGIIAAAAAVALGIGFALGSARRNRK